MGTSEETLEDTVIPRQPAAEDPASVESVIEADSLVEEISIDGMCGVY